jgi:hypothetical protein
MRIAVLAPVSTPVPPSTYGGTESVVGTLADGLVDASTEPLVRSYERAFARALSDGYGG